jgi:hypothetical protein
MNKEMETTREQAAQGRLNAKFQSWSKTGTQQFYSEFVPKKKKKKKKKKTGK